MGLIMRMRVIIITVRMMIKMMTLTGSSRFQESVCRSAGTGCSGNSHLLFLIITMNVMIVKMVMVIMMMI